MIDIPWWAQWLFLAVLVAVFVLVMWSAKRWAFMPECEHVNERRGIMQERYFGKRVYWIVTLEDQPAHVSRGRKLPRIGFQGAQEFATLYRRRVDAQRDVAEQEKWDRENDMKSFYEYRVVPISAELR